MVNYNTMEFILTRDIMLPVAISFVVSLCTLIIGHRLLGKRDKQKFFLDNFELHEEALKEVDRILCSVLTNKKLFQLLYPDVIYDPDVVYEQRTANVDLNKEIDRFRKHIMYQYVFLKQRHRY